MYGNSGLTGAGTGIMASTIALICGQVSVEMTADSRFGVRVIRLAATSVVALGLIWGFAVRDPGCSCIRGHLPGGRLGA